VKWRNSDVELVKIKYGDKYQWIQKIIAMKKTAMNIME